MDIEHPKSMACGRRGQPQSPHIIGIDLGTTFSVVGVWKQTANRIEIVPNEEGPFF